MPVQQLHISILASHIYTLNVSALASIYIHFWEQAFYSFVRTGCMLVCLLKVYPHMMFHPRPFPTNTHNKYVYQGRPGSQGYKHLDPTHCRQFINPNFPPACWLVFKLMMLFWTDAMPNKLCSLAGWAQSYTFQAIQSWWTNRAYVHCRSIRCGMLLIRNVEVMPFAIPDVCICQHLP